MSWQKLAHVKLPFVIPLLAEISVAEGATEVTAISNRFAEAITVLSPREQEQANEDLVDAIREWADRAGVTWE